MTQAAIAPLAPSTTSGSALATKLVNFEQAVLSGNSGSARPSYVVPGTFWINTTAATWVLNYYDGTSDIPVLKLNTTSHRKQAAAAELTVASAATANVLGAASDFVAISGNVTITSLGSEPLQVKFVRLTGAPILTHNATTLILPNAGANIAGAAGDTFVLISDASGNARVTNYQRASGQALVTPAAASPVPSGSAMLFYQAAAPTGWTKSVANDNKALRVVSGLTGGTSGGFLDFSTVFGRQNTDDFTLLATHLPAYNLDLSGFSITQGTLDIGNKTNVARNVGQTKRTDMNASGGSSVVQNVTWTDDTLSITGAPGKSGSIPLGGGNTPHNHAIDLRVKFMDFIVCTKD